MIVCNFVCKPPFLCQNVYAHNLAHTFVLEITAYVDIFFRALRWKNNIWFYESINHIYS